MDAQKDVNLGGALYEPPALQVLGTVSELTEYCVWGKALGQPDYMFHIPAADHQLLRLAGFHPPSRRASGAIAACARAAGA